MLPKSPSSSGRLLALLSLFLVFQVAKAAAPKSPDNFTFRWDNDGSIHATWVDDSNDETGFVVTYRTSPTGSPNGYAEVTSHAGSGGMVTYDDTPTNWPGCTTFYWSVYAFNGPDNNRLYSTASNEVTVVAPPRLSSASFVSGMVGATVTHTLTTSCPSPVYAASPLPAGFTFNASTGVITGTSASAGRFTINVSVTSGGKTGSQALKMTIFRPVPALVPPINGRGIL